MDPLAPLGRVLATPSAIAWRNPDRPLLHLGHVSFFSLTVGLWSGTSGARRGVGGLSVHRPGGCPQPSVIYYVV
jgi:hypothetical protein